MNFQLFCVVLALFWLAGIVASGLALRWSSQPVSKRFWPSLALSLLAMVIAWLGLTHAHIVYSKTVNGHIQYVFDSRWLFTALLVLGALAFICALWRKIKSPSSPENL